MGEPRHHGNGKKKKLIALVNINFYRRDRLDLRASTLYLLFPTSIRPISTTTSPLIFKLKNSIDLNYSYTKMKIAATVLNLSSNKYKRFNASPPDLYSLRSLSHQSICLPIMVASLLKLYLCYLLRNIRQKNTVHLTPVSDQSPSRKL